MKEKHMWNGEIVSVVLPTYREKNSIRECVLRFLELNIVDELIVVDNNAEFGTRDKIEDLAISILTETTQGYGAALKLGMKQAKGGLIILCEPDGTFYPEDIYKLLEYSKDCDAVLKLQERLTKLITDAMKLKEDVKTNNLLIEKHEKTIEALERNLDKLAQKKK